jgi:hypothetical protein
MHHPLNKLTRNALTLSVALWLIVVAINVIYHNTGITLIRDIYYERSLPVLNDLFESRHLHPIEFYYSRISNLLHEVTAVIVLLPLLVGSVAWVQTRTDINPFRYGAAARLLAILIAADVMIMALHITRARFGVPDGPLFSLDVDQGYSAIFQYLKEFLIAALLLQLTLQRRRLLYAAWMLLFVYLLADDSLRIHERLGFTLMNLFEIPSVFGIEGQAYGELIISLLFGSLLLMAIGVAHLRAEPFEQVFSKNLFALFVGLAFFGVAVDILHQLMPSLDSRFSMIEDGGEMIAMSMILWFVLGCADTQKALERGSGAPYATGPAGKKTPDMPAANPGY